MKVQMRGRNFQVTDKVKEYAEKRLGRMDRLIEKDVEAVVTMISEKNHYRVEVTIPVNGFILRGEEEDLDLFAAIDLVVDKIEKQMVRSKERFAKKGRMSITKLPSLTGLAAAKGDDDDDLKVRIKTFPVKPMMLEEAILRMDMVGHTFFAFQNAESGLVNVVYRRHDGHYGLLEPEA
jgi:putative sigma-54 modulation protein